jgi:hypothetical protein
MRPYVTSALAFSLSVGAHGLLVAGAPDARPAMAIVEPSAEVEIDVVHERAPPVVTTRERPRAASATVVSVRRTAVVEPRPRPPAESVPASVPTTPRVEGEASLSPTVVDAFGAWSVGVDRAPEPALETDGGPTAPRARDALSHYLAAAAAPGHLSKRPPPELRRTREGGFRYTHHTFEARILPDGTVRFRDRPPVTLDTPTLGEPESIMPRGGFDLTDAVTHDPYRHEKEWFVRETEGLRDRMARAHDAHLARAGLTRMRARLARVWADGSRSARERRRAIFELWDECADGDDGRPAREMIIRFVRRVLPAGRAGYSNRELDALNRVRVSAEPFAPYLAAGPRPN